MKWMYEYICIPLMQINNNVYAFFSGIVVALSTNLFTSLCLDRSSIYVKWHIYLAALFFLLSGAISFYLSVKMTRYQLYISDKHISDPSLKKRIIREATSKDIKTWISSLGLFAFFSFAGIGMLVANYAV